MAIFAGANRLMVAGFASVRHRGRKIYARLIGDRATCKVACAWLPAGRRWGV